MALNFGGGSCKALKRRNLSLKVVINKELMADLGSLHRFWVKIVPDCGVHARVRPAVNSGVWIIRLWSPKNRWPEVIAYRAAEVPILRFFTTEISVRNSKK